jgi:hypothetical protein
MGFASLLALALAGVSAQVTRPMLGPSATVWLWAAPGLVEVVRAGPDDLDLFLCGLSTDLRTQFVELRALDADGRVLARRRWELPSAHPVELALEELFAESPDPRPQRFTLIVGGLETSPGWLVVSLRAEAGDCGTTHPPGMWVQADPTVARQIVGDGRPGGS